tara:strand:+ start:815 stop:2062 length:1248 start_codon:yes stop_codon:yes gene_type:complete
LKRREFLQKSIAVSTLSVDNPKSKIYSDTKIQLKGNDYDVIVLGVGSMGSSSCYHLSKKGFKVLGLEQFDIPNDKGSHNGQSRIIRKAYFEHPSYVPLLEGAYKNWKKLENEYGDKIYYKTGLAYFGPKNHLLIKGSLESAEKYKIEFNQFTKKEQLKNYPQFNIPIGYTNIFEKNAGLIIPEKAIVAFTKLALKNGATINTNEKAIEWLKKDNVIEVKTNKGRIYQCRKLVISTGAWISEVAQFSNLEVTRQIIAWAKPKNNEEFSLNNFPCWTYANNSSEGIFYGFPILPSNSFHGPFGLKFAHHFKGELTNPNNVKRSISNKEEKKLLNFIKDLMPNKIESINTVKTCLYSYTSDEDFIVDKHPENEDIVITGGFSGHGFKFASIIGEIVSDLVDKGNSKYPIDFLKIKRFN